MTIEIGSTREMAVAGSFYPAVEQQLYQEITELLDTANVSAPAPKALILPHAGYRYSGPIAASGYKLLLPLRSRIKKVVLLGPSHYVPFHGIATPGCDFFASPLGRLRIDRVNIDRLVLLTQVRQMDAAHRQEHSLEVHLPFISQVLGDVLLTPLVVGSTSVDEVAEVLETVWGQDETLIIISSDLSHYHDYKHAVKVDRITSKAILDFDYEQINHAMACGGDAIKGLLKVARAHHLHSLELDVRNSGDTSGSQDRVVGYGAYAFYRA